MSEKTKGKVITLSFWTKVGVKINDLGCFKAACKQHGIAYVKNEDSNFQWQGSPVEALLHDTVSGRRNAAYLIRSEGAFKLAMDSDVNYSPIARRLGKNGGKVSRDYTREVIEKGVVYNGGIINSREEQPDGSLILKISAVG